MREALALIRIEAHITKLAARLNESTSDMNFDRDAGNLVKYARTVATVAGLARSFATTMTELEALVGPQKISGVDEGPGPLAAHAYKGTETARSVVPQKIGGADESPVPS